ncbi:MAG: M48 metallopeptidase family protein [Gemmatimonadaceae bacterium]
MAFLPYCSMTPKIRVDDRKRLRRRVDGWARRIKAVPRVVRIQRMARKWGSCSSGGIITLADDLTRRAPGFQDFVIAHELLHLRIPNHGKLFKSLMGAYVPRWRNYDLQRSAAARRTPRLRRSGANSAKHS